jgi:hypothetical protein
MTDYTKTTNFAAKDGLTTGNPAKAGKGVEVNTEFDNIATAIATKEDKANKGVANGYAGLNASSQLTNTLATVSQISGFQNSTDNVGFMAVPQNGQTSNYTLVLADAGKHIFHASGAGASDTYTIPANSSVAFPLGTVLTFINRDSNTVSIAINTDTLILGASSSTGTRSLLANGIATAVKVETTVWIITGTGLI